MLSFIILNYNTPQLTQQCVHSIARFYGAQPHEIIVVDNGSSAENFQTLLSLIPSEHTIVRSPINTGFGLGNMLGAMQAQGEYLCFLNNDVLLVEDCITPLLHYLSEHPEVGVVTPQQFRSDGSPAAAFRHKFGIRHDLFGDTIFEKLCPKKYPPWHDPTRTEPFVVSEINGSFMLFPSSVFWQIGGFDTNIFLFHEEYDIGRRIEAAGYTNVVYPAVRFLHAHGASSGGDKRAIRKERFISKIYCYGKYHNSVMTFLFRAVNFLKKLFSPKSWYLLPIFLTGNTLSLSMRPSVKGKNNS